MNWSHLKMLPRDGAWLIASKNRPDVGDVLTAIGAPSGCYPRGGTGAIALSGAGPGAIAG